MFATIFGGAFALEGPTWAQTISVTPEQAEAIAKEAYIYGAPMVQGYGTMFVYAIYKNNPQYKAPFNEIANVGRVFTPQDTAIITPNSDTPYSFLWADLRTEPLVLHTPAIQKGRYWSIQFVDLYTWNFDYAGTRTTGNDEGRILLAGPSWKGETPNGITKVIRSDTDFVLAGYRTQLFDAVDIDNVRKIQAGYRVETLSKFLGTSAPPAVAKIDFPPYIPDKVKSLAFFNYLNFLLQFCPTIPEDKGVRERFAKIGIEPGKPFNPDALSAEMQKALKAGMAEGQLAIEKNLVTQTSAASLFGTRDFMKNNYLNRATGAEAGIYGNSEGEAFYYAFYKDQKDTVLDGSKGNYTMYFERGKFPPVHAFWSMTLYDAKTKLLSANAINRYLINSPMLKEMTFDDTGGVTIYIQKDAPGKDKESSWLPAPDGAFFLQFRCYWPKEAVIDGSWQPPVVVKAK